MMAFRNCFAGVRVGGRVRVGGMGMGGLRGARIWRRGLLTESYCVGAVEVIYGIVSFVLFCFVVFSFLPFPSITTKLTNSSLAATPPAHHS